MAFKREYKLGEEDQSQISYFELVRFYQPSYSILHTVYAVPNGTFTTPRIAGKQKRMGLTAGIWDVSIDAPRGTYHGAKIELKSKIGSLSKEQKARKLIYEQYNYLTNISRSCDEAWIFTLDYLGLLGLKNFYYGNNN